MIRTGVASGKIILSGEYAVVFGHRGIAAPSVMGMQVCYDETRNQKPETKGLEIRQTGIPWSKEWQKYVSGLIIACEEHAGEKFSGVLTIDNALPLGRGMGSSTALLIAIGRALLGDDCEAACRQMENQFNPGHSGIDFEVIWRNQPILFRRGETVQSAPISTDFLANAILIDTGKPGETTPALVDWVKEHAAMLEPALQAIGQCTERLLKGESPQTVIPDHHRAQVELGVVPEPVQRLIADIEVQGGVAKIIGAGARTGGGGMVMTLHRESDVVQTIAKRYDYSLIEHR